MTEWAVKNAIDIAKTVYAGTADRANMNESTGNTFGAGMGAYIKTLAESLEELRKSVSQ
jgi:hypothetical protein